MGFFNFLLPAKVEVKIESGSNTKAGGTVKGYVFLVVKEDSVDADALRLRFRGAEKTMVTYHTGSGKHRKTHHAYGRHGLADIDINIQSFPGQVKKGQYYHPFEFRLPLGLPGSSHLSYGEHHFSIEYSLEARLHRTGTFSFDVTNTAGVTLLNPSCNLVVPEYLPPKTYQITQACCFSKGEMTIAAKLQSNTVPPNKDILLNYAFVNNSTSTTKAIVIAVEEKAYIRAGSHRATLHRKVFEQRIDGSEILNADKLADLKSPRKDVSERALLDILNSNKQVLKVGVSPATINDYDGTIVDVFHTLTVSLRSPFCITDPEFTIPFFVKGNAGDRDPLVVAEIVQPPEGWDGKAGPMLYIEAPVVYATTNKVVYDSHLDEEDDKTVASLVVEPSSAPFVPLSNNYSKLPFGDFFPPYKTALDKSLAVAQWAEVDGGVNITPEQFKALINATPGAHLKIEVSFIVGAAVQKSGGLTCKHVLFAAQEGVDNANKMNIISALHPLVKDKENGFIFNELNLGTYFAMTVAN